MGVIYDKENEKRENAYLESVHDYYIHILDYFVTLLKIIIFCME